MTSPTTQKINATNRHTPHCRVSFKAGMKIFLVCRARKTPNSKTRLFSTKTTASHSVRSVQAHVSTTVFVALNVSAVIGWKRRKITPCKYNIFTCHVWSVRYWSYVIVRVRVLFRKTVMDWRFDYLSGSYLQSQVKSLRQMKVFMPLVVILIGQFCRELSGSQDLKLQWLVGCCYFRSVYCLLRCADFTWGHVFMSHLIGRYR